MNSAFAQNIFLTVNLFLMGRNLAFGDLHLGAQDSQTSETALLVQERDGGSHHHGHGHHHEPSPSYVRQSVCTPAPSPATTLATIAHLDYQMHATLKALPAAIEEAKSAVEQGTLDTNRDKLITGLCCLIAAISGKLGVLEGNNLATLTTGQQLALLAQGSWGYGYWGPFLLDLDETDPGCGLQDFNKVVYEYSFITSLHQTYGQDHYSGGYTSGSPDDRPELRAYYLGEFGRKLKLELHCITSQAASSSEASQVVTLIEKYVRLGQERLELTKTLMSH